MKKIEPYKAKHKIRILTAGSLFDGHDAAINIMRRIMQRSGAEVIHLGHNRSVYEIVTAAIQEDVQGIAITSYQGGHNEFFKYTLDLLKEKAADQIKVFGGGGGTILPSEMEELHAYGITRIYSPDDGREMGLQGMINHMLSACDFALGKRFRGDIGQIGIENTMSIASAISSAENYPDENQSWLSQIREQAVKKKIPVLGITGTGGAGKSSLVDEIVLRFLTHYTGKTIGVISVDPSKRKTGGALLGDRIRMNAIANERVFMRSLATRQYNLALSKDIDSAIAILKYAGFDLIILETSGIGQSDSEIIDYANVSVYVMTPEFGAATQLEKIDMLDFADIIVLNKFDKRGALDALHAVKKQYQRNHDLWDQPTEEMPVFGTVASQFNEAGVNAVYNELVSQLFPQDVKRIAVKRREGEQFIIPPARVRYLSEIAEASRQYDEQVQSQSTIASNLYALQKTISLLDEPKDLVDLKEELTRKLNPENRELLEKWEEKKSSYAGQYYTYRVRNKEFKVENFSRTLSHNDIPKIALPKYQDWGDIISWCKQENVPGKFPFTAGVFPFKRKGEDPTRMFAGEGGPERTNKRFHYLSKGMPAKRLSTAFDSVTLYGNDPDHRPDIYGKVGNSGVNVSSLNDAKKLYSGFNLCDSKTSVSMTINGPASTVCAFFMNAAIDQQCELYIREHGLTHLVEAKLKTLYDDQGLPRPQYGQDLPEGNDGLGSFIVRLDGRSSAGCRHLSGYKIQSTKGSSRYSTSRYPKRRSGTEYLYFFDRVFLEAHGRFTAIFYR